MTVKLDNVDVDKILWSFATTCVDHKDDFKKAIGDNYDEDKIQNILARIGAEMIQNLLF